MKRQYALIGALAAGFLVGCGGGGGAGSAGEGARTPAGGGGARTPSATSIGPEDADRCLVRGRAELAAKRWDEAERRLEMAWSVDGRAEIAADLGRVEVELGKVGEAAAHLSAARDGGVSAVEAQLAALRPKLGSIALKPPSAGAEVAVFVDGWRASHRLPRAELWLAPGKHDVELRAGARIVARKNIDVQIGQRVDWDASVDGKIDGDVFAKVDLSANLDPNLNANLDVKPPSATSSLSTPLLVVGGIVGAGAIAFGTGLAVAASNLSADAGKLQVDLQADTGLELPCQGENKPAECALLEAKLADEKLFLGVGIPLLVTAGLIVGGGITYLVWPRAKAPDAKVEFCGVTLRPSVGPGSFSLQGTF
jgi:hypothetical protein